MTSALLKISKTLCLNEVRVLFKAILFTEGEVEEVVATREEIAPMSPIGDEWGAGKP